MYKAFAAAAILLFSPREAKNPYATLSPQEQAILQPAVQRYLSDQIKHNWSDLWEIQDETRDLRHELLVSDNAPPLTKEQFIAGMKGTMGSGFPELQKFELQSVTKDGDHFLATGCGTARREDIHIKGTTTFAIRIVDGSPKLDLFGFISDTCR
jgi:hypothetical protein